MERVTGSGRRKTETAGKGNVLLPAGRESGTKKEDALPEKPVL
jgi:hypothetical protein